MRRLLPECPSTQKDTCAQRKYAPNAQFLSLAFHNSMLIDARSPVAWKNTYFADLKICSIDDRDVRDLLVNYGDPWPRTGAWT